MKIFMKITSWLVAFSVLIGAACVTASVGDDEFFTNYDKSVMLHHSMMESFGQNSLGEIMYPEYFGGAFINDDGLLSVYVVVDASGARSTSAEEFARTLDLSGVIILPARFSMGELSGMMNRLNEFKVSNPYCDIANNFNSFWLADKENRIVVALTDYSLEQIEAFRRVVVDSPMIVFVERGEPLVLEANINPWRMVGTSPMRTLILRTTLIVGQMLGWRLLADQKQVL